MSTTWELLILSNISCAVSTATSSLVDIEVVSDYPIYGEKNGVFDDFISGFENATGIEFNRISYLKEGMNCLYGVEVINRFCQSVPKSYFKDVGIPNNFYLDYSKEPFEAVNTLTLIEDALYMLLKDVPDNKIIVEKLMKKFSILIIWDFFQINFQM